ncbi:MAG: hypothetical protein ACJAXT_000790 [Paracoccaceae bacterium]|jgi:hypothetical protein
MIRAALLSICLSVVPLMATAQTVRDCDTWEANARNLVDPVSENVRSYSNGSVRVIALDTVEPAVAWGHILVQFPAENDTYWDCRLISSYGGHGFSDIEMTAMQSSYDPATGLTLTVPISRYDNGDYKDGSLRITINQATGVVTAQ